MNNLIDNALKYTPSGGHVQVSLSIEPKSATALLRVKDTGIGIAPEDHAHIFDRFFRADKSRTRLVEATGTGLGLSICQAVTLAHGGTIRCESKLHAGTEFIVELPICKSPLGLQAQNNWFQDLSPRGANRSMARLPTLQMPSALRFA